MVDLPEAVVGNSSKVRQTECANIQKITGQIFQIHSNQSSCLFEGVVFEA